MNLTVLVWCLTAGALALGAFGRPAYAVGVYMLTFFAHPQFWWWGDAIEGIRWNFLSGVLLMGTLLLRSATGDTIERDRPLTTNAAVVLAFMVANVLFVHFLLAVNPASSMGWVINRLKFILLFFLIQYAIRDEKDYRIAAMAITLGMGYIGYEATINERGSFSGGRLEGIGAAGVTSSNQLASLLITGLPLATTILFTTASRWVKAVTLLCCAFTFNVVLMCNSRGAFLGVLSAGAIFLLLASGPARKTALKVSVVALFGTFMLLGDPEILARFGTTFTGAAARDNSAQSRIIFWTAASRMAVDYPLGSGGNSFSEGRGWAYMPRARTVAADTRAIHNGFLTELVDWGVQGFTLMMLFLLAAFRTIWRGRNLSLAAGDINGVMVFACMAAALAAWMVSSIFGDYLNDEWGFWAAAMVYAYLRVHAPGTASAPTASLAPAGARTLYSPASGRAPA